MTFIITVLLIALFLACMHQANQMTGQTPKRLICGLIIIMFADFALGYCVINGYFKTLQWIELAASFLLVVGIIFWLLSERRVGKPATR
jgi:hypothetical protein